MARITTTRFTKAAMRFAYAQTVERDGTVLVQRLPWAWVKLHGDDDYVYVQPLADGHSAFTPYRSQAEFTRDAPFGPKGIHYYGPI